MVVDDTLLKEECLLNDAIEPVLVLVILELLLVVFAIFLHDLEVVVPFIFFFVIIILFEI